jgi:hypothetical protein
MCYAYLGEKGVKFLIFTPNQIELQQFSCQKVSQLDFGTHGTSEKPQIYILGNKPRLIC